jgi:hypothetical protein
MSKSITNYDSQSLIAKTRGRSLSPPIFILCDKCYWCATYFDKTKIPIDNNNCPQCNPNNNNELTSFPIMSNESFTFDYNDKRGVELEFKLRRKDCQVVLC